MEKREGAGLKKAITGEYQKGGQGIQRFKPSQVFRRLLKNLFLYSSMPPKNSLGEGVFKRKSLVTLKSLCVDLQQKINKQIQFQNKCTLGNSGMTSLA